MRIDFTTRTAILGMTACSCVHWKPGQMPGTQRCRACAGTGNGKRGGRGRCPSCSGSGTATDLERPVMCLRCKGTAQVLGGVCDTIPDALWAEYLDKSRIRFVVQDRPGSWNEAYLGLGCLMSCHDYGATFKDYATDPEATEAELREDLSKCRPQLITILKEQKPTDWAAYALACEEDRAVVGTVCPGIAVVITKGGYSFRPDWEPGVTEAVAAMEPSKAAGARIGGAISALGGNGTLAAAGVVGDAVLSPEAARLAVEDGTAERVLAEMTPLPDPFTDRRVRRGEGAPFRVC